MMRERELPVTADRRRRRMRLGRFALAVLLAAMGALLTTGVASADGWPLTPQAQAQSATPR